MNLPNSRLILLLLVALAAPAAAQTYPAKSIRMVVGTSPGGSPDTFGRMVAAKLGESFGQFVVENRVGANGNLAAEHVAKSPADGYTTYVCDSAIWAINPHLYSKVPYNPIGDFAGISTIAELPMFLTLHPSVPAKTFQEFIAYAKANPGKLAYASAGNGSIHQITTELFKSLTGIDMVHVPFKGMGPGGQALVAGDVQVAFTSYTAISQFAKAGKVRMLAISAARRTPVLPDIPTVQEFGVQGFDMASLLAMLVPAGTPRDIVGRLNSAVAGAVNSPDVKNKLIDFGVTVYSSGPEQLDAMMRAEHEKYAKLVKLSGAKLD